MSLLPPAWQVTPSVAVATRLDEVLGLPRRMLAAHCESGHVRILLPGQRHGRAVLAGRPWLPVGAQAAMLATTMDPRVLAEDIPLQVLHADPHLLLIDKPAELATMPGPKHPAGTLANALRGLDVTLSQCEGALRPGIVHRLDRGTSGVMMVARDDINHHALGAAFKHHDIERRYLALVRGLPQWDTLDCTNELAQRRPGRRAYGAVAPGSGKPAHTWFRVLCRGVDCAIVEAVPRTGRTHQIRVQLATLGHPLVGDTLYGGSAARHHAHRLGLVRHALHAVTLTLTHPLSGQRISACAPLPADLRRVPCFSALQG